MLIWGVSPRRMELGLGLNFLLVGDNGPGLDVGEE